MRSRFLLAFSLILLCAAVFTALALTPAEVALVFYSPPPAQSAQQNINVTQDDAAIEHTQALLAAMQPFATSSSLASISDALSQLGTGITLSDISYSTAEHSLTLSGQAQTPDEVNTLRQTLQADPVFSGVTVPVAALLGSQGGGFTITMKVTH